MFIEKNFFLKFPKVQIFFKQSTTTQSGTLSAFSVHFLQAYFYNDNRNEIEVIILVLHLRSQVCKVLSMDYLILSAYLYFMPDNAIPLVSLMRRLCKERNVSIVTQTMNHEV